MIGEHPPQQLDDVFDGPSPGKTTRHIEHAGCVAFVFGLNQCHVLHDRPSTNRGTRETRYAVASSRAFTSRGSAMAPVTAVAAATAGLAR